VAVKLYLVRHGASTGNRPGNLIGQSDYPLSSVGEAQARAVAKRLAPLGPMPVYSSDLQRAASTAKRIAAAWADAGVEGDARGTQGDARGVQGRPPRARSLAQPRAGVIEDPRLRELALGQLEGCSWETFTSNLTLTSKLQTDPLHTPLPGGESLAVLRERVLRAVAGIVATASADACACIVSHDGPIRAIVNHSLGVPLEKWWVMTTSHGGLSLLEFTDDWVDVRFLNDTSHLAAVDYSL
jgi:broad specificity phosphatase PhoE